MAAFFLSFWLFFSGCASADCGYECRTNDHCGSGCICQSNGYCG